MLLKVLVNLVLVPEPKTTISLELDEVSQVIESPTLSEMTGGRGWEVTSVRDQIVTQYGGGHLTIEDQGGKNPCESTFPQKAASLLELLFSSGLSEATAYGFNINVEIDPEDATTKPVGHEIAARLLNQEAVAEALDAEVVSASVKLTFREPGRRYILTLEPRGQDAETRFLYASLNTHFDAPLSSPLGAEAIKDTLCQGYERLIELSGRTIGLS